jgi:hypothetical protein
MQELVELLKTDPNTANAFAALASAAIATLAFIVSIISLVVAVHALKHQRKHNVLSVTPLPEVTVADYEDSLRVKLHNNGSGPMIVISLSANKGSETRSSLIDWMPVLPNGRLWNHFTHAIANRSLQPGKEIVLLELSEIEGERDFTECRDGCRRALWLLTVTVSYTDIYRTKFPAYTKSLEWFGRNLPENQR